MSGTARLIGEEIELLADNPIVGPLPTTHLVSSASNEWFGYTPRVISTTAPGTQSLAGGASGALQLNAITTSQYNASPYFTGQVTPAAATLLAPGTIQLPGLKSFLGVVVVKLIFDTNKAAYADPPEYLGFNISWSDDIGGSFAYGSNVPILVYSLAQNTYTTSVPLLIPYDATRTIVNIGVSVANFQAANTMAFYSSCSVKVVQIN